jgi:formylmethanofuran dehydrogenase subunit E
MEAIIMRKSYWTALIEAYELNEVKCEWCGKFATNSDGLYKVDDENVCRECLENTEYDDEDPYLTLAERNA